MKSVNFPTKMMLDLFKQKSEQHSGPEYNEGHPYFAAIEAAEMIDVPTDDDKFRDATVRSLVLWAGMTVARMVGEVMNEISAVGKVALKAGPKGKAAGGELLSSMGFVQGVFQSWANEVDLEHLADFIYEDGKKRHEIAMADPEYANRPKPEKRDVEDVIKEIREKLEEKLGDGMHIEITEVPDPQPEKPSVPVTPDDIMKMLFEKQTKPSVN